MFLPEEERIAARILIRELGLFDGIRSALRVKSRVDDGEPFGDLPPPESEDEQLSRQQIGPAIVLYRVLQDFVDDGRAMEITEEVVIEGAVAFLGSEIGSIDRDKLKSLPPSERTAWVKEKGEHFFNATVRWDEINEDEVEFTVTHCKFPPLCAAVGEPQLAPLFCKGDAKFFGGVEDDVDLDRPHTIAEGAETCPFHIYFRQQHEPE